jgi:hypothetical protein
MLLPERRKKERGTTQPGLKKYEVNNQGEESNAYVVTSTF